MPFKFSYSSHCLFFFFLLFFFPDFSNSLCLSFLFHLFLLPSVFQSRNFNPAHKPTQLLILKTFCIFLYEWICTSRYNSVYVDVLDGVMMSVVMMSSASEFQRAFELAVSHNNKVILILE